MAFYETITENIRVGKSRFTFVHIKNNAIISK